MPLNSNQRGFVEIMKQGEESEEDGFIILAKRPDAYIFLDELLEQGLIAPRKAKGPVPVGNEGLVNLPYWRGFDYLVAISKQAAERNDIPLAKKVAKVIGDFSENATSQQRENFHTWGALADALSALPLEAITNFEIEAIRHWLSSKYDRSFVAESLGLKLLPRLIESGLPEQRVMALELFDTLTGFKKKKGPRSESEEDDYGAEVDGYWVNEIIRKNLASLVAREPRCTADIFRRRLSEAFSRHREKSSWLYRPAIEDHDQNMRWHAAENISVEGLRDTLVSWLSADLQNAAAYVSNLFTHGKQIERRIAIHIFNRHFGLLRFLTPTFVTPALLDMGLIHESYTLLKERGAQFSPGEVTIILDAVNAMTLPSHEQDPSEDGRLEYLKARWLSALVEAGIPAAAERIATFERKYGPVGENPDFLSYHTSFTGPGPSPFSKAEILGFLLDGSLIDRLNAFVEQKSWLGPNKRALSDTLEEAVVESPRDFLAARKDFLMASPTYQYAFLSGYLRLWGNERAKPVGLDWETVWPALIDWVWTVISSEGFWGEPANSDPNMTPNRNWFVHEVAELVQAGTRDDKHAIAASELSNLRKIVAMLLAKMPPEPVGAVSNAVNHVINSGRGKALEALVNFALRSARVEDKQGNGHKDLWGNSLEPLFQAEIDRVPAGNQEFVVLFGQYVAQLMYLSTDWLESNIRKVFRPGSTDFKLAIAGLAYASSNRSVYKMLAKHGIIENSLALEDQENSGRERIVERVAIALLWSEETLDGEAFNSFFQKNQSDDLEKVANVYWSARSEKLSPDQIEFVREYWRRASDWAIAKKSGGDKLSSALLQLLSYFESFNDMDQVRVLSLIKRSGPDDRNWFLGEEFDRLADAMPEFIGHAIIAYLGVSRPFYDHDNHLLSATRKVLGTNREIAMEITNQLRHVSTFKELYAEIRDLT